MCHVRSQRDYYRADQDEVFSTPVEVARTLPDDILKIAGWCRSHVFPQPLTLHANGPQTRLLAAVAMWRITNIRLISCRRGKVRARWFLPWKVLQSDPEQARVIVVLLSSSYMSRRNVPYLKSLICSLENGVMDPPR